MPIAKSALAKQPPKLAPVKRKDGWWLVGITPDGPSEYGPYADKAELEDSLRGLLQFWEHKDERSFWTNVPLEKKYKEKEVVPVISTPAKPVVNLHSFGKSLLK